MTTRLLPQQGFATLLIAAALCVCSVSAYATETSGGDTSKPHPVAATKKAAKSVGHGVRKTTRAVGHGFRDGARAVGHGTRDVTRKIGHAFRDTARSIGGKKD
jgi:hypothetical protein